MGTGYLKVELRIGDDVLPVANEKVIIKDSLDNIIKELITDQDGNTEKISLPAPDSKNSLDPNYTGEVFASYNVEIQPSKEYQKIVIYGVQVFDGQLALLPIKMLPNTEPFRRSINSIYIPEQLGLNINKNIQPEDNITINQMLYPTANEVKIPQNITVHLGAPNRDAKNVTVPFSDYIKNVASSEIYPTWPTSAIYANMYAQISFALNRINTIWYRSRGYNFDITNSTAYDQYFVYGRNIFQNISQIADTIFNIFVRRQGRKEPYFTQYCNGTTVTCPGLSQWGTVPLAQNGQTPIQILKTYYPDDIMLVESNNFTTQLETYPGTPLKQGDNNDDVKLMQKYLNRISGDFPSIPKIPNPDGDFKESTTNSVKVFQNTFNLDSDGIIGKNTWYSITAKYVAVKKLAELDSEGEIISISNTPPTTTIRIGARGELVVELQFLLNYISVLYSTIYSVIEDGVFGTTTENSVKSFQKEFGLAQDGVVGPTTWKKLYDVYHKSMQITNSDNNNDFGEVLTVGSKNENVKIIQESLNKISNTYPKIPKLSTDGMFGNATQNAVKSFQEIFGIEPTGIVDKDTFDKIKEIADSLQSQVIKLGDSGEKVKLIQSYLTQLNKSYSSIPILVADGSFGNATKNAVIQFQKLFDLDPDGIVGNQTWNKLIEIYDLSKNQDFINTTLRLGSYGEDVKKLQNYLINFSKQYSQIPSLTADGSFGNATRNAVIQFQKLFDLTADGIVGKQTWTKLLEQPVLSQIYVSNYNLKFGDSGQKVKAIQNYLITLRKKYAQIPALASDGFFGNRTRNAIIEFQKLFALKPTGIVEKNTFDKLLYEYKNLNSPNSIDTFITLSFGSSGKDVLTLQTYLNNLSKIYNIPKNPQNGNFDLATQQAVIEFQKLFGINPDGIIDKNSWQKLKNVYNSHSNRLLKFNKSYTSTSLFDWFKK